MHILITEHINNITIITANKSTQPDNVGVRFETRFISSTLRSSTILLTSINFKNYNTLRTGKLQDYRLTAGL